MYVLKSRTKKMKDYNVPDHIIIYSEKLEWLEEDTVLKALKRIDTFHIDIWDDITHLEIIENTNSRYDSNMRIFDISIPLNVLHDRLGSKTSRCEEYDEIAKEMGYINFKSSPLTHKDRKYYIYSRLYELKEKIDPLMLLSIDDIYEEYHLTDGRKVDIVEYIEPSPLIKGVHFGGYSEYTWKYNFKKFNDLKVGDIVEVDTIYGPQYVKVTELYRGEGLGHRSVISIVKKEDY